MLIKEGSTIGFISLSNGLSTTVEDKVIALKNLLHKFNYKVIESTTIYSKNSPWSGTPKEKANELHKLYLNPTVHAIFDLSGGDLSNEVLPYIDFNIIKNNPKLFVGYSDLSVIINSIYSQTSNKSILYRPFNLLEEDTTNNIDPNNTFISCKNNTLDFNYRYLQGSNLSGVVVGGNLRCTLKLAGTKYLPSFDNKILLLESLGGDVPKIVTYLNQYKLINAFNNIKGIILGTFTEMEKNNLTPTVYEILLDILDNKNIPIIKTDEIGHNPNSKAIIIGNHYNF